MRTKKATLLYALSRVLLVVFFACYPSVWAYLKAKAAVTFNMAFTFGGIIALGLVFGLVVVFLFTAPRRGSPWIQLAVDALALLAVILTIVWQWYRLASLEPYAAISILIYFIILDILQRKKPN